MVEKLKNGYYFLFLLCSLIPLIAFWSEFKKGEKELSNSITDQISQFNKDPGLRKQMNHLHGFIHYQLLGVSPRPSRVIKGGNDFLFFVDYKDQIHNSYRHKDLKTPAALDELIRRWDNERQELKEKNIQYVRAVFPNKSSLYHEFVPKKMQALQEDTVSRVEQINHRIKELNTEFKLIDLLPPLKAHKQQQLYYKHDTHWNDYGAFIAYQQLMKEMGISPYPIDSFNIEWQNTPKGDLIDISALYFNTSITEEEPLFSLKNNNISFHRIGVNDFPKKHTIINENAQSDKTLLVFRDSYGVALSNFLSIHFKQTHLVSSVYDYQTVLEYSPDIVLCGNVERYFAM